MRQSYKSVLVRLFLFGEMNTTETLKYNKNKCINMELQTIQLGTRRLQKVTGGYTINIPMVFMESFDVGKGDKFNISATTDGTITMEKVEQ